MDNEQSWSTLLDRIITNVQEIIRSEVRLAKAELTQQGRIAAKAGTSLAIGAVFGLLGGSFILVCIACALAIVLPWWLATLIVGLILLFVSTIFVVVGVTKMRTVRKPVQTIQSVRETVQWAKTQGT